MPGSFGVGDALIFQPRIQLGETPDPRLRPEHLVTQIANLVLDLPFSHPEAGVHPMTRQNDIDRTLVRTARALLDWNQPDLATVAVIALATLKRFKKGYRVPTDRTLAKIFKVLKKAGVEFQHDGKRLGVSISVRKVAKS